MLDNPSIRFIVLSSCACFFVFCDLLAAHWGKSGSIASLTSVLILAPFSYILFGYLNQKYPLAIVSSWVVLVLCITSVFFGFFVFGEQLTVRQTIGVIFSITAITLLLG